VTVLLGLLARLRGWEAHPLIVGFLEGDELDGAGSRHCRDVLTALGVLTRLRGVVYGSGMGLNGLTVCATESPRPSSLADLVERAVAEEGLLPVPAGVAAAGPTAAPPWRYATVTLAGPPLSAQHTMLDRPDLESLRLLVRTVSALEDVVRGAGSLR